MNNIHETSDNPILLRQQHLDAGLKHSHAGRLDEAIKNYRRAIEVDPSFVDAYNNIGAIKNRQQRYREALEFYETALRLDPQRADVHFNLACTYESLGKPLRAIEEYKVSNSLRPTAKSFNNLGILYRHVGETKASIDAHRSALQVDPEYTPALHNLANRFSDAGNLDEALTLFRKAVDLDPACTQMLTALAHTLGKLER